MEYDLFGQCLVTDDAREGASAFVEKERLNSKEAKVGKTIVITGVSSGIGAGLSQHLLSKGYRVIGTVRKAGDAAALNASPDFTEVILMSMKDMEFSI